jgi:drug/metabolite transporter (DMT)-like permease
MVGYRFFIWPISIVIGYAVFYTLLSRGTLSRLSIQLYLIPIVSAISSFFIVNKKITPFTVVGGQFSCQLSLSQLDLKKKDRNPL